MAPLARDPAGTGLLAALWLSVIWGVACRHRPALGAAFATVPLSALAWVSFGLVPLYERFSLWIVPALYVLIVLALDWATSRVRRAGHSRPWTTLVTAVAVGLMALSVSLDIVRRGRDDLALARPIIKHQLDDRGAVSWLMQQRQPGDALMTTRLGWPAVWWYGRISIADPEALGRPQPDGGGMYEMVHVPQASACQGDPFYDLLKDQRRVLVYLGFRDVPEGFESMLIRTLKSHGKISAYAEFSLSLAAVVDIRPPVSRPSESGASGATVAAGPSGLEGCVAARPAHRW